MADPFDIIHLGEEDVQSIIDWAVRAGAMIFLIDAFESEGNDPAVMVDDIKNVVTQSIADMPDVLARAAGEIATSAYEGALAEEKAVDELMQDLENIEDFKDL